jgi:DNA-binding beta-propeller fold protein YncE
VPLEALGFIDLPRHVGAGGFDHAAVHGATGLIYVAHTANDAVDVIDAQRRTYVGSVQGLTAVAGALVSDELDLVFTSNRGENTVGMFAAPTALDAAPYRGAVEKIGVGMRPNGLAFSASRARLLVAHVGDPALPGSCTVSVVDVAARKRIADLAVPGRTRWTVHDPVTDTFHVNIADPPQIVLVSAADPVGIRRVVPIPHAGPHGLDIDVARRRLFCACDAGVLLEIDADTGAILATEAIAGVPDVVFVHAGRSRLYVAIGEPGVIQVFDTAPLRHRETVSTEAGAHTLAFDARRDLVCAFMPASHRAAVYRDRVPPA